jgi:hypothetical protein
MRLVEDVHRLFRLLVDLRIVVRREPDADEPSDPHAEPGFFEGFALGSHDGMLTRIAEPARNIPVTFSRLSRSLDKKDFVFLVGDDRAGARFGIRPGLCPARVAF